MPDLLRDNPAFEALREHNRRLVLEALEDPKRRDELNLSMLVALYQEQTDAGERCRNECQPALHRRLGRLERFRAWLIGVGVGLAALASILSLLWAIFKGN